MWNVANFKFLNTSLYVSQSESTIQRAGFGRQIKRLSLELNMIFYLVDRRGGN